MASQVSANAHNELPPTVSFTNDGNEGLKFTEGPSKILPTFLCSILVNSTTANRMEALSGAQSQVLHPNFGTKDSEYPHSDLLLRPVADASIMPNCVSEQIEANKSNDNITAAISGPQVIQHINTYNELHDQHNFIHHTKDQLSTFMNTNAQLRDKSNAQLCVNNAAITIQKYARSMITKSNFFDMVFVGSDGEKKIGWPFEVGCIAGATTGCPVAGMGVDCWNVGCWANKWGCAFAMLAIASDSLSTFSCKPGP